jgi:hypothetical protein
MIEDFICEFLKNLKQPEWYTQELGGNGFMKKTRSRKFRDTVPLTSFSTLLLYFPYITNHHDYPFVRLPFTILASTVSNQPSEDHFLPVPLPFTTLTFCEVLV